MAAAKKTPGHWLVKQEPTAYSWDDFVRDGRTAWTGVRNYAARLNLASMRVGDRAFFYHSVVGKEIVGLAKVIRTAYPDLTATDGKDWVCVDLQPEKPLRHPVSLEAIKANPALAALPLIRQSRLSVVPVTPAQFAEILRMGGLGSKA